MRIRRLPRSNSLGTRVGCLAAAALLVAAAGAKASPPVVLHPQPPTIERQKPAPIMAPAPAWIEEAGVPGHPGGGRAAVNARGDTVVAWADREGVRAAVRRPGAGWGEPRRISAEGDTALVVAVGLDDAGGAVVVWRASDQPGHPEVGSSVRAATLAGEEWAAPRTLYGGVSTGTLPFQAPVWGVFAAVAGDGRAVAAWTVSDSLGTRAMWSGRAADGSWSPASPVPGAPPWVRGVAIDATGRVTVAADEEWLGAGTLVVVERPAAGPWSAPVVLDHGPARFGALVARGDAATIAWSNGRVLVADRPGGEGWSDPVDIGQGGAPQLAAGPGGELLVTWTGYSPPPPSPFISGTVARSRTSDGEWGAAQVLSLPCWSTTRAAATIDAHGDAAVMWFAYGEPHHPVQFATRPAHGAWSASRTLEASPWDPVSLTAGPAGDLLLIRNPSAWGPQPALLLPHERWTAPVEDGLACGPAPADDDPDPRERPTRTDQITTVPPGGRTSGEDVVPPSRAAVPIARGVRVVRSGRRAVVAFTLTRAARVRAIVRRADGRGLRFPPRRLAPGRARLVLGPLPAGRHRLVLELRAAAGEARLVRAFRVSRS